MSYYLDTSVYQKHAGKIILAVIVGVILGIVPLQILNEGNFMMFFYIIFGIGIFTLIIAVIAIITKDMR